MQGALGRFFNEPPQGQGSRIISARRGNSDEDRAAELSVLEKREAKYWVQQGKLSLLGNRDEEWVGMSSTKVRAAVKRGDESELKRLVSPEIAEYIQRQGLYL
ncbi:hypothetical protein BCR39DRAFT_515651 [Naematelia encephala]|uniref:Cytidyltransferase-like domain-containing protein n=1 Tax=Naematelia encephala TaxID=71784 RepID=A0A1Y2BJJ2_9TREE|nr:hypothetical protein BCR39DRAFT_515651 [Naematelia encephala]